MEEKLNGKFSDKCVNIFYFGEFEIIKWKEIKFSVS